MPPLARRLPRSFLSSIRTTPSATSRSAIKPLQQRRHASDPAVSDHGATGHESHYDQPGGWLWGIRPGEKYEKEGWEYLMWYGFTGCWVVAIAIYVGKEDTSIQTWALEEARRRLEKEGILEDPNPDGTPILEEGKK